MPREVGDLFHQLRIAGNRATHAQAGDHAEALSTLKIARELGIWFHRTFADAKYKGGAFVPPPDPADATNNCWIVRSEDTSFGLQGYGYMPFGFEKTWIQAYTA